MAIGCPERSHQPVRAQALSGSTGGAKQSAAGDGVSRPPGGKRSAQRRHTVAARRRHGIKARRGETPLATRCTARKPGPARETLKTWSSPAIRSVSLCRELAR